MRGNSKIALIAVLVFVFPLLFMWVTQNFFSTAIDNIRTAERQRIGMLHDSLNSLIIHDTSVEHIQQVITTIGTENKEGSLGNDISKIRIYENSTEGYVVLASLNTELIDKVDETASFINTIPFSETYDFQQSEFIIDGKRIAQVFKRVIVNDKLYYIFSEHDFSRIDRTMTYRRQQSYLGLTGIFIFLITLAYWVNRQTSWNRKYISLENQLEERDLFSNMIAHEFRSPLTAIKGYASFLQESKELPEEDQRYANNIRVSAERLIHLVNDFLEVARIQSDKTSLEKKVVDARTILIAVTQDLQSVAKEKELDLYYKPSNKPIPINTDKNRLIQVLVNIVSNAIKYTDEGSVEISCTQNRNSLTIRIKDTGMGISAEDQKKLFSPFERVGGVERSETTGTGLGMYITQKLVTLLGGTIGVESIKSVGSHVVITLPLE